MIVFLIIIALILFSTWVVLCYPLIKFIAGIIGRLTAAKWVTNKITVIVLSIVIALLPFSIMLFSTSAKNYKTAYIQPQGTGFKVTVKGKRMLMSHDPVSALFGNTYEDSISFVIPRLNGVINSNEIQVSKENYKSTGSIAIDKKKMIIQLFYYGEQTNPNSWNGKYYLKSR
jgi:hypothetical protein